MPSRRIRFAPASVVLIALIAGCTPGTDQSGSSPAIPASTAASNAASPTASDTAAASPTPTPTSPTPSATNSPTASAATRPSARSSATGSAGSRGTSGEKPVIVIDPGHSGRSIRSRTTNGLLDFDYPNTPEITEMFDISSCVAQGLRADGYTVVLTKSSVSASVSLTERARIADRAGADLAISVHDDHSQGPTFQATYSQLGVNGEPMYRGRGSHRTVFDQPSVARASARYTRVIADRRAVAQSRPVRVTENVYTGRAPLEPGNLALVQLLSHVPWVYNETGALTGGDPTRRMTLDAETGYATGLLDGVEAAVPTRARGSGDRTSRADLRSCLRERRG